TAGMITAILAVLKTGAAYLPLDPAYPRERIAFMLTDARPVLTVTRRDLAAALPPLDPAAVLALDDPATAAALDQLPGTDLTRADLAAPPDPACPAYVIYTSGSTGTPKGVVVSHTGLASLHASQRARFLPPAGAPLRAALTASFSFDASWETLLLLAAGHELHLIDDQARTDPAALVRYTADQHIDIINTTPSYLGQLLAAGLLTGQQHRPAIILPGGEP